MRTKAQLMRRNASKKPVCTHRGVNRFFCARIGFGQKKDGYDAKNVNFFGKKRTFFFKSLDFFVRQCYNKCNHAAKDRNPTGLSFM